MTWKELADYIKGKEVRLNLTSAIGSTFVFNSLIPKKMTTSLLYLRDKKLNNVEIYKADVISIERVEIEGFNSILIKLKHNNTVIIREV